MKKGFTTLLSALILMTGITGCSFTNPFTQSSEPQTPLDDPTSLTSPDHPVILLFEGIANADVEIIGKAVNLESFNISADVYELAKHPIMITAIRYVNDKLDYKIKDTLTDGNTATLKVAVEYPDLSPILASTYTKYAPIIASQMATGNFDAKVTGRSIAITVSAELVKNESIKTKKQEIEIKCAKVDDKWQVIMDDTLINVCTANLSSAVSKLDLSTFAASGKQGISTPASSSKASSSTPASSSKASSSTTASSSKSGASSTASSSKTGSSSASVSSSK